MSADSPLVVVAASARALAESARRSGEVVLAVDAFGDEDTLAVATDWARLRLSELCRPQAVLAAIDALPGPRQGRRVLLGGGFDGCADVVEAVAGRHRLLNAPPAAWRTARGERLFAELGIRHPETRVTPPEHPAGWLLRDPRRGAGTGLRPASRSGSPPPGARWQRRLRGTSGSLLFCAGDRGIVTVGFNRQWCSPAPGLPFRFGGVASGADLGHRVVAEVESWSASLVAATGLRGLCSIDFLVDDHGVPWALEVNPRPTASVELYDRRSPGLLALHLAAVAGRDLPDWQPQPGHQALTVVYARRGSRTGATRPVAAADWSSGRRFKAGEPVCTWHAAGASAEQAMRRARQGASRWLRAAWGPAVWNETGRGDGPRSAYRKTARQEPCIGGVHD